jgi:fatty-acyl-CoA synthase
MTPLTQPTIGFATERDILALETIPLADRRLPPISYHAIAAIAAAQPAHPALHFFFDAAAYERPLSYSYGELIAEIRRTANMLRALGVGPGDVVSIILPNLPQMSWAASSRASPTRSTRCWRPRAWLRSCEPLGRRR